MTIEELRGLVDFRYMRESERLKKPTFKLDNGEFLLYYNIIASEILNELSISELTTDITISPVTVYTEYALPATYGGLRNAEIIFSGEEAGLARLELTPIEEMPTAGTSLISGTPNRMAIFPKNDGLYYVYLYPLSGFAGTLRIRYKVVHRIDAGSGASASLVGNVLIPLQYINLLMTGILAQLLPELEQKYRFLLSEAAYLNATPSKGSIDYNLGGF